MIRHFLSVQFVRFLVVGGVAALLNWVACILLSRWLAFAWAVALAYGVGMGVAFVLNRLLVFPHSSKPAHRQLRDFVLVNACSFPVVWGSSIAIEAGLRYAGLRDHTQAIAHAISIASPMLATFLIYKFVAFKDVAHERS